MELEIKSRRVRPTTPTTAAGWSVWKKKTSIFGWAQFGVAELTFRDPVNDFREVAVEIRNNAKSEFGGRWYRGAGFGVVLRLPEISGEPLRIFESIDLRNRLDGNLWQWTILVFEAERAVVGKHMWYHGYLHDVFLEVAESFARAGYDVITSDTETDSLVDKLQNYHNALNPIKWLDSILN